jgi:Na+-driven multidrug efflux pump
VFGLGSALVAMVGANVGAGQLARAERVAWTGAGLAAGVTATIGLGAAVMPGAWLGLFTSDPQVRAVGALYLTIVGPAYGFFGMGLALYFASQGAGRLAWPLTAGFARLTAAAAGGWVAGYGFGWELPGIFAAMALALVIFGTTTAAAVRLGAWR